MSNDYGEPAVVGRVLRRFGKVLLRSALEQLGVKLPPEITRKEDLIFHALEGKLSRGVSFQELSELDIFYAKTHGQVTWGAYRILHGGKYISDEHFPIDVTELKYGLDKELSLYFKQYSYVHEYEGSVWIRIALHELTSDATSGSAQTSASEIVFVVYIPHSSFILISSVKNEHKAFILKAVCGAFECVGIDDMGLRGSNLASLQDLAAFCVGARRLSLDRIGEAHDLQVLGIRNLSKRQKMMDTEMCATRGGVVLLDTEPVDDGELQHHQCVSPNRLPTRYCQGLSDSLCAVHNVTLKAPVLRRGPKPAWKAMPSLSFRVSLDGTSILHGLGSLPLFQEAQATPGEGLPYFPLGILPSCFCGLSGC